MRLQEWYKDTQALGSTYSTNLLRSSSLILMAIIIWQKFCNKITHSLRNNCTANSFLFIILEVLWIEKLDMDPPATIVLWSYFWIFYKSYFYMTWLHLRFLSSIILRITLTSIVAERDSSSELLCEIILPYGGISSLRCFWTYVIECGVFE